MNIYIHTINGQPGVFSGQQICYATRTHGNTRAPATSLRQIRAEQAASEAWRTKKGFSNTAKLSYVRYVLEKQHSHE
jgi:hypothetical protein